MSDTPNASIDDILNDLSKLDPTAEDFAKRTRTWLGKIGVDAATATRTGGFIGAFIGGALVLVGIIISIAVGIGAPLIRIFLRVLTKARTDTVSEQVDLSAAVLSEFLATEIDPNHLKTGKSGDQTIAAARAIGGALIGRLTQEFSPDGTVTPETGEKAAQTFAGYSVNFAVQNAMLSTLADALSLHLLQDFRELGVEVARNLGLGRMVRAVLQPFIRNTMIEPYDQALRKRYRPDLLTEQHAVNAFSANQLDGTQLHDILARKGYSDAYQAVVIDQLTAKLDENQLAVLLRNGRVDLDFVLKEMGRQGIPAQTAGFKLTFSDLQRADAIVATFKATLITQYVDGLIDEDQLGTLLDQLPLAKGEKEMEIQFATIRKQVPRAFLTWTEVENSFIQGAVDLDYVDRWLQRRGYSEEDQLLKELLLLQKLDATITKEKAAAGKKARKASPTPPTTP